MTAANEVVSLEELNRWILEVPEEVSAKLKLSAADLKRPFNYLLDNTKGISDGLHNEISPGLQKALDDKRSLVQQVHDEVGNIAGWCVEFDKPQDKAN